MPRNGSIWSLLLAIATAMAFSSAAHSGVPQGPTLSHSGPMQSTLPGNRFIVTYRAGAARLATATKRNKFSSAARTLGFTISPVRELANRRSTLVQTSRKLDRDQARRLATELMKDPDVLAVEPDRMVKALLEPNDPSYAQQWHLKNGLGGINVAPAWTMASGDGVVVAVIDTGITPHPDLAGNILPGYDFISDPNISVDGDGRDADAGDPGDWHDGACTGSDKPVNSSWHGTHVAGTVAALTNNGIGVAGVAFGAKILPVRALGRCGGLESDLIDAVIWASGGRVMDMADNANPAEVINLSLGGSGVCSTGLQYAIDIAESLGSTLVVAGGNGASNAEDSFPANCNNVIAVSAVGPDGALAFYSNRGTSIDIAAPGGSGSFTTSESILSTLNLGLRTPEGATYGWLTGTSMAAAHVSGVVALMQSAAATPRTPKEIERILINTAYANGGFPQGCHYDYPCGSGVVDARAAVAVAKGLAPLPPNPPKPPTPFPILTMTNGITYYRTTVPSGMRVRYQIEIPNGASDLRIVQSGGTGNSDMYIRRLEQPRFDLSLCAPLSAGNREQCDWQIAKSGMWYIILRGNPSATHVSLRASFVDRNWPRAETAKVITQDSGHRWVRLGWSKGARRIDIHRNGSFLMSVPNGGGAIDPLNGGGSGPMTYVICSHGTQECANPVSINLTDYPSSR